MLSARTPTPTCSLATALACMRPSYTVAMFSLRWVASMKGCEGAKTTTSIFVSRSPIRLRHILKSSPSTDGTAPTCPGTEEGCCEACLLFSTDIQATLERNARRGAQDSEIGETGTKPGR